MNGEIIIAALILGSAIIVGCSNIAVAIDKLWETLEEINESNLTKSND